MKKYLMILFCGFLLCGCKQEVNQPPVDEPVVIVSNDKYADPKDPNNAYALAFNQLSENLKAGDMEGVAEDVAICFVYDFFTLKNKEDSSDVGGLVYLPQNRAEEFSEYAQNYFYKNYPSIVHEYGIDNLPEVSLVEIESKTEKTVEYLGYTYDGFEFNIVAEYADTKVSKDELKTNMVVTCLIYDGKAMVISLK